MNANLFYMLKDIAKVLEETIGVDQSMKFKEPVIIEFPFSRHIDAVKVDIYGSVLALDLVRGWMLLENQYSLIKALHEKIMNSERALQVYL